MVEHTRSLGFRVAFAIGLGTMIAAGIFSLSGTAVARVGSSAVIAFLIAAVVASITAASYSEFASIYSENGGGYLFSSQTFENEYLLFAIGASLFLGYSGTTAFYLATMDEWMVRFVLPEFLHVLPHGTTGVLTALLLGALNIRGTEESGSFQVLVTGAKVAVLIAFIGGAFAFKSPSATFGTFVGRFEFEPVGIVSVAALAFITFFGFSAIAASAGEIIEPKRTVPRAIGASIITVTILYILVIISMINAPTPASVIAQEGETAMGRVAADFLGPAGVSLIVAGAIFSMVSASNASILAATGIGSLMGRQGQAPRRMSRIHPKYGTPFWSATATTATIVVLIVAFIAVFPAEGGLAGLHLGLNALTGFATLNLLGPLAIVNAALIYSRRKFSDLKRPVRVPFSPIVPALGIIANLALITNLPPAGVMLGIIIAGGSLVVYGAWGGQPDVEEMVRRAVAPRAPTREREGETAVEPRPDQARILVPIARPGRARSHARLAAALGTARFENPFVQIVNVTQVPDQTPYEIVVDSAEGRADAIGDELADAGLSVPYTVEGHLCREVAFDILQTARDDGADLIVMGYPEEHPETAEKVEYNAPCDVVYAQGFPEVPDLSVVTVGVGGGPHHRALLPLVGGLAHHGSTVNVVRVEPTGTEGTPEVLEETLAALPETVDVHEVRADNVAMGLVERAIDVNGPLIIGATRTRLLRQWVFGSTPDRVIELARRSNLPVLVYAGATGVPGRIEDALFPIYRYYQKIRT